MEISTVIKLLFWLIILTGSIYYFIYWLVYVLKQRKIIRAYGEMAIADIIDYKTLQDADGKTLYCPVLEFTTRGGQKIIVNTEAEDGRLFRYQEDKQLKIFYLPDDPHQYYVVGSVPLQVYLLVFGIPVIACAIYFIVKAISAF
jgi:hypothetical protein